MTGHKLADVPVGASDTPACHSLMEGTPPPMRLDHMTASLVGFMRVRRHSHRHARSAPMCGVSHGPRAYRVRVPKSIQAAGSSATEPSVSISAIF
jgi:hypothetical protein